jgi:predicted permease
MLTRARLRLRSVLQRRRLEREMQEEMAGHLDRATERLVARGLAPDAARREALREFGPLPFLQDRARAAWGARWADEIGADLRFGRRHLARAPLTTALMFAVLAVGIALSVLLFSAVHSVAAGPPAGLARADDLVRIRGLRDRDGQGFRGFGEDELRAYRALGDRFAAVVGSTHQRLPLVVPGDPERRPHEALLTFVTDGYLSVLGVRPALGPGLPALGAAGDAGDASASVAVIAHRTWRHLFAGDPGVIGSVVLVGGVPVTIVGVAPERFHGIAMDRTPIQLWMPSAAQRALRPVPGATFLAVARLRPGVTLASASAAVRVVARRVAAADDSLRALAPSAEVVPLLAMNSDRGFDRDVGRMALLVGLLAVLVLLVTCTNVSALLMGLAAARRQEVAVRLALGAARGRLVRQMLTESVLLAVAAGATALGLTWLVLDAAARRLPTLPFELAITWPAAAFALGVALAVGVGFGLAPALHGTRVTAAGALRDSAGAVTGGRGRLQRGLVVAQIACTQPLIALLAMVLLVAIGELRPPRQTAIGDRLITVRLRPPVPTDADASPAARAAWERLRAPMQRLAERLPSVRGVEAVTTEWPGASPLGGYVVHPDDRVPGVPHETVRLVGERAAPGYLATLGVRVVRGRDFAVTDVAPDGAPARPRPAHAGVVIGADVARRLWRGVDPIGRRLQTTTDSAPGARTLTVVGVIDDPMAERRKAAEEVRVYLPPDTTRIARALLLRTSADAGSVLPAVRAAVHASAPDLLSDVRSLAEVQEEGERHRRVATAWISAAGGTALLLSAIGLYAVVAFAVGRRTREIAVRMSVGAPGGRIVRRFVADGLRLAAMGLAVGLPVALLGLGALPLLDSDFPALPVGPVAAITALAVVATALVASWLPARRAAAVDPAVVLRAE